MAVTAAIQLGWLGTYGLREVATRCAQGAHYLYEHLMRLDGVEAVSTQPFFREFALRLSKPASEVIELMAERGVLAGLSVAELSAGADSSVGIDIERVLLVTVTERRTKAEIDHYVKSLQGALQG